LSLRRTKSCLHREDIVIVGYGLWLVKHRIECRQVRYVGSTACLIVDKFRWTSVDTTDTGGVLCGECCHDDTYPVVDYELAVNAFRSA